MASLRNQRRHECHTKRQHSDKAAALKVIGDLLRMERGAGLAAYRCRFCKCWHIGHLPAPAKRGILNRTGIAPVYTHWLKKAWS
jgi:hypothetical protein